jgi:hypothetical protein
MGQMGETYNYDEDKYSPEKEEEKPIYESSEGPIQKLKKIGQKNQIPGGKSGSNMLNSGESFGMNPLRSNAKPFQQRHKFDDNLLQEEDDYLSSALEESGEIHSSMFK